MEPVQMTPEQARTVLADMNYLITKMEQEAMILRSQYDKFKALVEEHLQTIEK